MFKNVAVRCSSQVLSLVLHRTCVFASWFSQKVSAAKPERNTTGCTVTSTLFPESTGGAPRVDLQVVGSKGELTGVRSREGVVSAHVTEHFDTARLCGYKKGWSEYVPGVGRRIAIQVYRRVRGMIGVGNQTPRCLSRERWRGRVLRGGEECVGGTRLAVDVPGSRGGAGNLVLTHRSACQYRAQEDAPRGRSGSLVCRGAEEIDYQIHGSS